jgi:flavorubredoxin
MWEGASAPETPDDSGRPGRSDRPLLLASGSDCSGGNAFSHRRLFTKILRIPRCLEFSRRVVDERPSMKPRPIADGVEMLATLDWDRRLFDALIPLPDGTSYNAYLVRGRDKTALLDASDAERGHDLRETLAGVPRVDVVVAHHAEQDHSGQLPWVLERYPQAVLLATARGKGMLVDHLRIPDARIRAVADGETLDLGGKTLEFLHTPWVHWPETMCTWLREDRILFSCDFFGSHLATTDLDARDEARVLEAARRYFAEIMMPFRGVIQRNLEKLKRLDIGAIAPSHGPVYRRPALIVDAYRDWVSDRLRNLVVLPYVSMHGSTARLVRRLVEELTARGVAVEPFEMTTTDLGKLASALVDAATLVVGTPTVLVGPHPTIVYAAALANALKPKLKHAAVIGSYGWSGKAVEQIAALIPDLKVEVLGTVLCKGLPQEADYQAIAKLAETIAEKHKALGLA